MTTSRWLNVSQRSTGSFHTEWLTVTVTLTLSDWLTQPVSDCVSDCEGLSLTLSLTDSQSLSHCHWLSQWMSEWLLTLLAVIDSECESLWLTVNHSSQWVILILVIVILSDSLLSQCQSETYLVTKLLTKWVTHSDCELPTKSLIVTQSDSVTVVPVCVCLCE